MKKLQETTVFSGSKKLISAMKLFKFHGIPSAIIVSHFHLVGQGRQAWLRATLVEVCYSVIPSRRCRDITIEVIGSDN